MTFGVGSRTKGPARARHGARRGIVGIKALHCEQGRSGDRSPSRRPRSCRDDHSGLHGDLLLSSPSVFGRRSSAPVGRDQRRPSFSIGRLTPNRHQARGGLPEASGSRSPLPSPRQDRRKDDEDDHSGQNASDHSEDQQARPHEGQTVPHRRASDRALRMKAARSLGQDDPEPERGDEDQCYQADMNELHRRARDEMDIDPSDGSPPSGHHPGKMVLVCVDSGSAARSALRLCQPALAAETKLPDPTVGDIEKLPSFLSRTSPIREAPGSWRENPSLDPRFRRIGPTRWAG